MLGKKEATNIYNTRRNTHAWYTTNRYEGLRDTHMLPRLTIDEQKVISACVTGPGESEKNLGKYSDMTPYESRQALISLIEQELITYGPIEDWML